MAGMVISARWMVDGVRDRLIDYPVVTIEGDRIMSVCEGGAGGPHEACDPHKTCEGRQVLDLGEATLLPGLICCHSHLNLPGDGTLPWEFVKKGEGVLAITSARNARVALLSGVTTIRDNGGLGQTTSDLKHTIELGYADGPRVMVCGQPVTITGGHCHYFGGEADGVDGVTTRIRQLCKAGVDYVKVMGTGGGSPGSLSWQAQYSRQEIAAMVREAHRAGKKITVHCLSAESMLDSAESGADQVEHAGFFAGPVSQQFDPEIAQRVGATGIYACATNCVSYYAIKALMASESLNADGRQALSFRRQMLDQNLYQVGRLREAGVRFLAGPDAGWLYTAFDSMANEIWLLGQAGLPTFEAIASATSRAADALGISSSTGSIRRGLLADIIAVRGDVTRDLRRLTDVRFVMKGGVIYRHER